jgi:uncharacterized protein (UPF0548 family)
MFYFRKPSAEWIDATLRVQRRLPFSYREVGATRREDTPAGFRSAVHRELLGEGADSFERAKQAIREWRMFPAELVELCWSNVPIEEGSTVGVLIRRFGLWTFHVCRIVYVVDEADGPVNRFGFAYGTLPRHFECGEERFLVEWDRRDNQVWYEVRMFSRPANWFARIVDPIVRRMQRRFGVLTKKVMREAVDRAHAEAAQPALNS